jgi:hypothetical protein
MGDSRFDDDSMPPHFATEILRRCSDSAQFEEVAGDLCEIYEHERLRVGRRRAAARYWVQVTSIALRYVLKTARQPRSLFGWQLYPLRVVTVAIVSLAFLKSPDETFVRYLLVLAFLPELVLVVPVIRDALRRLRRAGRE